MSRKNKFDIRAGFEMYREASDGRLSVVWIEAYGREVSPGRFYVKEAFAFERETGYLLVLSRDEVIKAKATAVGMMRIAH